MSCGSCAAEWLRRGWWCWECGGGLCLRAGAPSCALPVADTAKIQCERCSKWCRDEDEYDLHREVRLCGEVSTIDNVCAYFTTLVRGEGASGSTGRRKKKKLGFHVVNYDDARKFLLAPGAPRYKSGTSPLSSSTGRRPTGATVSKAKASRSSPCETQDTTAPGSTPRRTPTATPGTAIGASCASVSLVGNTPRRIPSAGEHHL